jgi:gas vesicle protein
MTGSTSLNRQAIVGLVAGLGFGLVVGLVCAPQSGKEIREKIAHRINWFLWTPEERYLYLWKRTRGS